jgi:hypothetical protein
MEVGFVRLEALVTSMMTKVKSNTFESRKAKDWEYDQSYGSNVDLRILCGNLYTSLVILPKLYC